MFSRTSSVLACSLLVLLPLNPVIQAQETADKKPSQPSATSTKPTSKDKATAAATKAKIEQQKALAISLLVSLANDARNFSDQKLRARTLSRIADALWEPDPEQGRALLRKAWDSAELADQDSARRVAEDRARQQKDDPNGPVALIMPPDLRSEVLRTAAKRDRALGEEFLDKLTEARKREAADATSQARPDPFDPSSPVRQRLRLANQLLDVDVERALQFADPVLNTVTMDSLDFLSTLRDKNAAAADQRFARMLAIAEADMKSDANTISLLSSYLFTPHLFITFEPDGGQSSSSTHQRTPPPEVGPELRNAFFRTAAGVLLRPLPAREQDSSSSGLQGKYLVIRRLMPLFEQYATKEIADQLRSEMAVLGQTSNRNPAETNADDDDDDRGIQRGITPDPNPEDVDKALLDQLDRAKTSEQRDSIYLQLTDRAARRGDMRARDYAEKIEDSDLRKQAKPYVDLNLAMKAVEKKEVEKELLLADKGDLTHIQKAWLLSEAAKAMPPADHDKALDTLGTAMAEARRIDVSDPDRPRALIAVANAYLTLDRARAWETILEVAKASNSAAGFNGEDGRLTMKLQSKNMTSMRSSTVDEFNLPGVFRVLAKENASQSIEIARSFEGEAPRSSALIAIARALLSEGGK